MDHAGPVVLLVDGATRAAGVPGGVPVVSVDDPAVAAEPATGPRVRIHPGQLAYVIHTSGSTGQPKGVMVTQQELVRLLCDPQWVLERHERVLLVAPYAFDVSSYEIWMPLLHGGQVVIAPPGRLEPSTLRTLITRYHITGLHLTAGLFRVLAEQAADADRSARGPHRRRRDRADGGAASGARRLSRPGDPRDVRRDGGLAGHAPRADRRRGGRQGRADRRRAHRHRDPHPRRTAVPRRPAPSARSISPARASPADTSATPA